MAMVVVDDSCTTGGLAAQVTWLGLRVDSRLCAVLQFIKWTEWTLAMACGHDDSTINIVLVLLLLLFIVVGYYGQVDTQWKFFTTVRRSWAARSSSKSTIRTRYASRERGRALSTNAWSSTVCSTVVVYVAIMFLRLRLIHSVMF